MKILFTTLALVGCAAANQVQSYTYSQTVIPVNDWFNFKVAATAEAAYKTSYAGASNADDASSEKYGAHIYSYVKLTATFELFNSYKHILVPKFTLFDIYPMVIDMANERNEASADDSAHSTVSGYSKVTLAKFTVVHIENAKVCERSFVDAIKEQGSFAPTCDYDSEIAVENTYVDSYWAAEPLKNEDWYGMTEWFSKALF